MIYIFPELCIDSNIGLIYGQEKTCHSGHFVNIGHNGLTHYGLTYGRYWCLFQDKEKCRSVVKAELKNVHWSKSYGQNKIE